MKVSQVSAARLLDGVSVDREVAVLEPDVTVIQRYRPVLGCSYLRERLAPPLQAGVICVVASPTTALFAETTGSPKFLGDPCLHALL